MEVIIEDAVSFGNEFEDYLESEFPLMSLEQRADMGRKLIEFIEFKESNEIF